MGEVESSPAITCALAVTSLVGMDGMKSAVPVKSVDVEVAGPGRSIEPRDGLLDL